MRSERVPNDLGATAGLRYRNGRPRTSVTERISGGGEPHPESPDQGSAVTLRRRKKPPWRRSLTGWDERPWRKWPERPNPIRFWAGIGSSSQESLMDRDFASEWADPRLLRKSSV